MKELTNLIRRIDDEKLSYPVARNDTKEELICPVKKLESVVTRIENPKRELFCPVQRIEFAYGKISDQILNWQKKVIPSSYEWLWDFMQNEFYKWNYNDFVFIESNTGTGKSTFIKKVLETGTRKCLILTNRRANLLQINEKISQYKMYGNMIMSYQHLEMNVMYGLNFLNQFDFIFLDEAHYFMADSNFNPLANISFSKIINAKKPAKIFMSATLKNVRNYVVDELCRKGESHISVLQKIKYYQMESNKLNIEKITAFSNYNELIDEIQKTDEKWIIFVKSSQDGKAIVQELLNKNVKSIFLDKKIFDCGTKDECNTFQYLIEKEKFMQQVLVATKLLDNGVNIFDKELKNIAIYDYDPVEIIQMIGRKRCLDCNDTAKLYLYNETKRSIGKRIEYIDEQLSMYNFARNYIEMQTKPPVHYLNTKEGDLYRLATYYNKTFDLYFFNDLGLKQLQYQRKILKVLKKSESPFDEKLKWLKKEINIANVPIVDLNKVKQDYFMAKADEFIGVEFDYGNRNQKREFHKKISDLYWEVYSKEKGERSDRPMNIDKLNLKFDKNDIPLHIELNNKKAVLVYFERA